MRHATRIGRLGGLALGLGIGAAVAAAGTASADPALTSPPFDPNNFAASVDGMTLFPDASGAAASGIGIGDIGAPVATAGTVSVDPAAVTLPPFDPNNFAISAFGIPLFHAGSALAVSNGFGLGNIAIADGANAFAQAGGGTGIGPTPPFSFDSALAYGADAHADALGFFDSARTIGNNANAVASGFFDYASILNTGSGVDGANAQGIFDIASVVGTDSSAVAGYDFTTQTPGSFDLAAAFGDMLHAMATGGNFLVDIQP